MENQDLLNLCRLNLMQEHVEAGIDCADKTAELKTIGYTKRQLVNKIIRTAPSDNECHYHPVYGFVPEADCPVHDRETP